jgi:hypothetical protein
MVGSIRIAYAALGALLVATTTQAASSEEMQVRSNGPNMPRSREVVPSDIRPQDPPVAGSIRYPDAPGARSRWHDIQRPPVRPPGL